MPYPVASSWCRTIGLILLLTGLGVCGCETIKQGLSDHLTHWNMLEQDALEDPIKAVGGDGIVFQAKEDERPLGRQELGSATPETLVAYYAPIFVQQRVKTDKLKYPYPAEYDCIGTAHLKRGKDGKLESYV